ncbi:MAG: hypothetical protein QOI55_2389, partial [Actinomycetota bacterium]|nr:hypothetical protein [Actinomycetota bacterium]
PRTLTALAVLGSASAAVFLTCRAIARQREREAQQAPIDLTTPQDATSRDDEVSPTQ